MKKEFLENGVYENISKILISKKELSQLTEIQLRGLQILVEKHGNKMDYDLPSVVASFEWEKFKFNYSCGESPEKMLLLLEDYFRICKEERNLRKNWKGVLNGDSQEEILQAFSLKFLTIGDEILKKGNLKSIPNFHSQISEALLNTILPIFDFNTIVHLGESNRLMYAKDIFVIGKKLFFYFQKEASRAVLKKILTDSKLGIKQTEVDNSIRLARPYVRHSNHGGIH